MRGQGTPVPGGGGQQRSFMDVLTQGLEAFGQMFSGENRRLSDGELEESEDTSDSWTHNGPLISASGSASRNRRVHMRVGEEPIRREPDELPEAPEAPELPGGGVPGGPVMT